MPEKHTEFRECDEAMEREPLPFYDKDPFLELPVIRRRVGEIIALSAVQPLWDE